MFETQQFFLFIIATLLLNITPGQDTMYIIGRTLTQGKKAGVISVLGINTGVLCHTIFAALGLALLLQTQPVLYAFVKMTGALYLTYLGIKMLLTARKMKAHPLELPRASNKRLFVDGFLTNLFNPKVALFFITFLPQFIPSDADGATSFLLLGQLFILCSVPWSLTLVALAAAASRFLKNRPQSQQTIHKVSGLAFIGMGTAIVLQR